MARCSAAHVHGPNGPGIGYGVFDVGYAGIALLWFGYLLIALFFYFADAFSADRRNNAMLFWKSMPQGDFKILLSKLVAGLTTREIARAYLTTEATVAQRVVRAKRTLTDAGAALEEPSEAERDERLTTVLSVIYLLYNEGYSATAGSA